MSKKSRYVPKKTKQEVIARQKRKCGNSPNSNLRFIGDYECPRWKSTNGFMDNYDLDHVIEHSLGGSNDSENIMGLCLDCHRIKSINFQKYKTERKKLNTKFRILQTKSLQLDEEFNVDPNETDFEPKCDKMIDVRYDKTANYTDETETLKLKLEIEKERTKRATIEKERLHKPTKKIEHLIRTNSYLYTNIDDLTLLQQYFIIVQPQSPYKTIIDNLNFHPDMQEYHNVYYDEKRKDEFDVYNGDKLIPETANQVVKDIITNYKPLLDIIFNRFRVFLSIECQNKYITRLTGTEHQSLKLFLRNKTYEQPKTYEADDPIFNNLMFTWNDVVWYIAKMTKLNIDLSQPFGSISCDINKYDSKLTVKERTLFSRLLNRINILTMCNWSNLKSDICENYVCNIEEFIDSCVDKTDNMDYCLTMSRLYENYSFYCKQHNCICADKKFLRIFIQLCTENYVEKSDSVRGYVFRDFRDND